MSEVTQLLKAIESGDARATNELLPIVYEELRRLARARMCMELNGHTLQPTALVHEAYLRLVGADVRWENSGHFFAAAAEAMRRIMIDSARRKNTQKHGGQRRRIEWTDNIVAPEDDGKLLSLDNALMKLEEEYAPIAALVKLRFFAGMTIQDAARVLKISTSTAERRWAFARAWLNREMQSS